MTSDETVTAIGSLIAVDTMANLYKSLVTTTYALDAYLKEREMWRKEMTVIRPVWPVTRMLSVRLEAKTASWIQSMVCNIVSGPFNQGSFERDGCKSS